MAAHILCVRCKARYCRFVCERCSDRYCSKTCQVLDWPIHKKMCFPMPSLLEIPNEHRMSTMGDQRDSDSLAALTYYTPNQYHTESRNNDERKIANFTRAFCGRPSNKPVRRELCDSRYLPMDAIGFGEVPAKKADSIFDAQPILPSTFRDGAIGSNDVGDIINLAVGKKIDGKAPAKDKATNSEREMPHKPWNWDEDIPDHIHKLERLMPNNLRNWEKPFALENDCFVAVVHFDESPTVNCWVVQNQLKTKRQHLLDELNGFHRNNKSAALQKVIVNEVYSVRYKENYYRAVCVYQMNSNELLVRLIDVGLTFQTKISAVNTLAPRFRDTPAFALEINLEKSLRVTIGQILKIKQYEIDETGKINVKLTPEGIITTTQVTHQASRIPTVSIAADTTELYCLDYSNIEKGYIAVCRYDAEKIKSIEIMSEKIEAFLKSLGRNDPYAPKLDEPCFAYHQSDRHWYRAECIGVIGDKFEVFYVDYGNTSIVSSTHLRKFASEFSQPSLMHLGYFKDLSPKQTKQLAKKIIKFFEECPVFPVDKVQDIQGMLMIDCPKLIRSVS